MAPNINDARAEVATINIIIFNVLYGIEFCFVTRLLALTRHLWYSNGVFIVVFCLYHWWNSINYMTFYAVNRQTIHFSYLKNFDTILKRYTEAWLFSTTFTITSGRVSSSLFTNTVYLIMSFRYATKVTQWNHIDFKSLFYSSDKMAPRLMMMMICQNVKYRCDIDLISTDCLKRQNCLSLE